MSDNPKISLRLPPALHDALAARVRQRGTRASAIICEALEAYLGLGPTLRPTIQGQLSDTLSDSPLMSDMSAKISALVSDVARLQERLEELDAYLATRPPRVRQRQTAGPTPATPADMPQPRTAGGQRKLTPRQVRALRDKHLRGVPVPALMEEYGISRASVFRYLHSDKRAGRAG